MPEEVQEEVVAVSAAGPEEETVSTFTAEEVLSTGETQEQPQAIDEAQRAHIKAIIEAVIYITDEPLTQQQIASALQQPMAGGTNGAR